VAPPQAKPDTVLVVGMVFPADPAVLSVTVTVDPLAEAVKAALSVLFRPMAVARLVASSLVVPPVPKCVLSVVPFVPLARLEPFQVYLLPELAPRLILSPALPAVLAVTVTVVRLELAVTPAAVGHKLIAAAKFEAKVVVLELVWKVPAVELPHALEPFVPTVTLPQEKMLLLLAAPTEKAETLVVPLVVFVTVTVLPLAVAVVPTAEKEVLQALIASLRFVASVAVALLVT